MRTFFNILQTLINIKNKRYPDDPFTILESLNDYIYIGEKNHIMGLMNSIYYKEKECKKESKFSKNAFAKFFSLNSILENTFYEKQLKETIFDIFTKTQKYYFAFTRLAYIYKIKKYPYVVTDDLIMNKLDPNHKLTFILVENKSNFLFNINEIINIIQTAIGHSPDFFCQPLSPLNPYNNQPLSNATLYNIYFQMKQLRRVIPLLFHCFFLENFDKNKFIEHYEPNIREFAIKKYIFNSPHTILYSSVISMLKNNQYTNKLIIDKTFPKDLLVDIFRPFLFQNYISNYYIKDTTKMYNSKYLLHIKLKQFYKFNPAFGRKNIKLIKQNNNTINKEYILNTKHISFYNIPFSNETIKIIGTPLQTENTLINYFSNVTLSHNINYHLPNEEDNNSTSSDAQNQDDGSFDESEFWENRNDEQHTSTSSDTEIQDENDSIS